MHCGCQCVRLTFPGPTKWRCRSTVRSSAISAASLLSGHRLKSEDGDSARHWRVSDIRTHGKSTPAGLCGSGKRHWRLKSPRPPSKNRTREARMQANNRCCPKCLESGIEVPTLSDFSFRDSEGHMEIRCPNGHRFFADDPSVMRAPALKGGIPPEYLPAQPGVELETVSLNKMLVTAAKQRFGHGVRAALESLLAQAMTGGF